MDLIKNSYSVLSLGFTITELFLLHLLFDMVFKIMFLFLIPYLLNSTL